jgi:hypothetical protein
VRQAVLLFPALALAACSSGQLGDHVPDQTVSPGTVTLRLLLPSTRSFCDQLPPCQGFATHITLANTTGQQFETSAGSCPTFCSVQCTPQACPPAICVIGGGVALTGDEMTWDGSYYEGSTCGSGTSCLNKRFVLPGHYTAQMCATPGTLSGGTIDSSPPTCTASGPQECVAVQFDIPSANPVEASLPDTIN